MALRAGRGGVGAGGGGGGGGTGLRPDGPRVLDVFLNEKLDFKISKTAAACHSQVTLVR